MLYIQYVDGAACQPLVLNHGPRRGRTTNSTLSLANLRDTFFSMADIGL